MFRQLLFKRFVNPSNLLKPKFTFRPIFPVLDSFTPSFYNLPRKNFFSTLSSFKQNLNQANYQEEMTLVKDSFSPEDFSHTSESIRKYSQSKDCSLLTPDELRWISDVLFSLGCAHKNQGNNDKALQYLKEYEEISKKLGIKDSFKVASKYFRLRTLQFELTDSTNALASHKKALKFCEQWPQENAVVLSHIYLQLVQFYGFNGEFQEATECLKKSSQALLMVRKETPECLAEIYFEWACMLKYLEEIMQESQVYFWKARDLEMNFKPRRLYGRLDIDIDRQTQELKWKVAYDNYGRSKRFLDEIKGKFYATSPFRMDLSAMCLRVNKFEEAEKYFQEIIECSQGPEELGRAYQNLAVTYEGRGMPKEALKALKKSLEYKEQIVDQENSIIQASRKKIADIEAKLNERK